MAAFLSGQVLHRGMKIGVCWHNGLDLIAVMDTSDSGNFIRARWGEDSYSFPPPCIVVESTRVEFRSWTTVAFSQAMITKTETAAPSRPPSALCVSAQAWAESVSNEVCGYEPIVESICKFCTEFLSSAPEVSLSLLPRGFLLFGAHGTGKSSLLRSIFKHSGLSAVQMNCSAIFQAAEGDAERLIGSQFAQARAQAPCFLLLDDLDMIAPSRHSVGGGTRILSTPTELTRRAEMERRVVSRILGELDNLSHLDPSRPVFVLASSRFCDRLDASILQPKRLEKQFELRPPLPIQRFKILSHISTKFPFTSEADRSDVLAAVTARSHGMVGAELESVCRNALIRAASRSPNNVVVTMADFVSSLAVVNTLALAEYRRRGVVDNSSLSLRSKVDFSSVIGLQRQIKQLQVRLVARLAQSAADASSCLGERSVAVQRSSQINEPWRDASKGNPCDWGSRNRKVIAGAGCDCRSWS